jgi:hypothetical protein
MVVPQLGGLGVGLTTSHRKENVGTEYYAGPQTGFDLRNDVNKENTRDVQ